MITPPQVETIRVDDIPMLLAMLGEMNIKREVDREVKPHGLWQGITPGTIIVIWLCYILTECDHRLEPVQRWVNKRRELFNRLLGIKLRKSDLTDDRLANVLTMVGDDQVQGAIDRRCSREWITMYELPTEVTRYDSTTVSVYHKSENEDESILGFGHSKDHRPDLAQFKVMLSTLEMGLPLTVQVVNGKRADDKLYIPAYDKVSAAVGHSDFVCVGDSKMAAWATRCHFVTNGSRYLCPYRGGAARGEATDEWIERALEKNAAQKLDAVTKTDTRTGEIVTIANVHSWQREQVTVDAQGQLLRWQERVLVSHSPAMQQGLLKRRIRSEQTLFTQLKKLSLPPKRGRKRYRTQAELQKAVDKLLKQKRFTGIISVTLAANPHKDGGERWIVADFQRDSLAWEHMVARLGWQIYLTNLPPDRFDTSAVVHLYRRQPQIEYSIARLKSRNLHIRPLYLRDEQRIVGLTWLLVMALRLIVLMEFRVRRQLAHLQQSIYGLKSGSAGTGTQRPTTEKMLEAFDDITWTIISLDDVQFLHITPLTPTQSHILRLLHLSPDIYERLASPNPKPLFNLRE